jgi:hypothetical protein
LFALHSADTDLGEVTDTKINRRTFAATFFLATMIAKGAVSLEDVWRMAVSASAPPPPHTAPVSLYLDLAEGRTADLEVIARAALAFAGAIRETAYVIDPSVAVRVELVSGTEGSLSINAIIRSIRSSVTEKLTREVLIAAATSAAIWFSLETGRWVFEKILDHVSGMSEAAHLTDAEKNDIATKVAEIVRKRTAHHQVERVYHELDADPAVRGVGVTNQHGTRPESIVPKSDFPRRSLGMEVVEGDDIVRRVRRTQERVVLIRPVLEPGTRRWQFAGPEGRFGAAIKDNTFLNNLLNGHTAVPMVAGIQIDVALETTEERRSDVWMITNREITRVGQIYPPPVQTDLMFSTVGSPDLESDQTDDEDEC